MRIDTHKSAQWKEGGKMPEAIYMRKKGSYRHKYNVKISKHSNGFRILIMDNDYKKMIKLRKKLNDFFEKEGYFIFNMPHTMNVARKRQYLRLSQDKRGKE